MTYSVRDLLSDNGTLRPLLYVCAPFATRTPEEKAETDRAIKHALALGWCPIYAPDLLAQHLDEFGPNGRELREAARQCAVSIMLACDSLLVVGERRTDGMIREMAVWMNRPRVEARRVCLDWTRLAEHKP